MSQTQDATAQRTPWHVWVVGVIALLRNAMGPMDYVMTQTRNEAYLSGFTPEQLAFFEGFPAWVVAAWATAVWGGVLGALLLLLRKRAAVPVLLVFSAAIFLVAVGLYADARAMQRRGVLA